MYRPKKIPKMRIERNPAAIMGRETRISSRAVLLSFPWVVSEWDCEISSDVDTVDCTDAVLSPLHSMPGL